MTNPRLRIPADVAMQMDPRNTPYNPKQVYEDPWAMLEAMQEPIPPGSGTCPTDPEDKQRTGPPTPIDVRLAALEHDLRYAEVHEPTRPVTALDHQIGGNHYTNMAIQPVEFIHANGLGFCEGAIVKYVTRYKQKNGVEDLRKARHFIDILIDFETR